MLLLFVTVLITGCLRKSNTNQLPIAALGVSNSVNIDDFFDEAFEREVSQSPEFQTRLGRRTNQLGQWDDYSDEFAAERIAQIKADLERLQSDFEYDALTNEQMLSYDLFVLNSERDIENFAFRRHHYVVDQFNGQLSGLITMLQNNHRIENEQDAKDYISRIRGLGDVLREYTRQLQDRASFGVIAPAFSFKDVLMDARAISSGAPIKDSTQDNIVFIDFREKLEELQLDAERADELLLQTADALKGPFREGFMTFIAEIERQQASASGDMGVWSLPNGEAFYKNRIYHHTTLNLTADEIHAIGLEEVARIHDEMRYIKNLLKFNGTLQEFFEFIREDSNNYYEDSDSGRERFLADARAQVEEIYRIVGSYFNELPDTDLEVRRVEPWRENSTSIAFYNRPSEDGSRPGIYYANLADMTSVQKYVFSAITYHESVPGHHFQIALAQELDAIPKFRKYSGYGAFTEGWALYAEQLAKEMGFYVDPYHNFGRLQNELWRSVRLVLDTGIHAKKWSRQQSIDYFRKNTPLSEGDIVTEVERFFVNPGQALGYKIGMLKILELRDRARKELGDDFDIREFHDSIIGAGSLPLTILERQVDQYISAFKLRSAQRP
jgi:uncharacterized protein (DUF885 family)